jgi:hypothetical protein
MAQDTHRAAAHQRTLGMIFEHPTSHNIEWRDVIHMLDSIGTTADGGHDGLRVTVNQKTVVFHHTQDKTLTNEQVQQMRHFLRDAGIQVPQPAKGP